MQTFVHLSVFFTRRQNLHQPVHSKVTGAIVGTSFRTLGTRMEAPPSMSSLCTDPQQGT